VGQDLRKPGWAPALGLDGDHLREDEAAVLRAAGFAEIGTLWQLGENRILCAVTPA
jgi:hypothetical protein